MTPSAARFPYSDMNPALPGIDLMPLLPITLSLGSQNLSVMALLDTGATVNVLPYSLGLRLGADWDQHKAFVQLAGNLAQVETRTLVVIGIVGQFPPVPLAFAWAKSDNVPLLLGQTNFFLEFDACFFRSARLFEVKPSQANPSPPTP